MGAALAAWTAAAASYAMLPRASKLRLAGRIALTLALVLMPAASTAAFQILFCVTTIQSGTQLAVLDGGAAGVGRWSFERVDWTKVSRTFGSICRIHEI